MTTWRPVALVVLACAIATSPARAQSAVNAGVDAFVRGDYQRAAEALAPIIDRWPMENDQMADFLMAAMYESGLGVSQDYVRACALYVRADTAPRSPTEPPLLPAAELTGRIQEILGPDQTRECLGLSTVGLNPRFQPVTFNLGPAHWIKFELSNATMDVEATIDYQFQEKTVPLGGMLAPGVRFLPIEHTELHEESSSNPRHFIQFFTWQPAERGQWSLRWWVSEVVRDKLAGVTTQDVLTVKQPPADWTIDVRQLAVLRVNADGDAEWIVGGDKPRSERIETGAERQAREELEEQSRRRHIAESKVDWSIMRDVHRTPTFRYADGDGCGNVFLYGWSEDRSEVIAFRADRTALALSTTPQTLDIAAHPADLQLTLHLFDRPQRGWPFCTDVGMNFVEETWRAVGGAVSIEVSPPGVGARAPHLYRATVRILGAEFVSSTGARIRLTQPITLTAIVGWISG